MGSCVYAQGLPDGTCDYAKNMADARENCPFEANEMCEPEPQDWTDFF